MSILVFIGLAVLAIGFVALYNSLVRRRNRVDQAYSSIDVQLVQRYDLIPKLVETVKQYMGHERSLLEEIVRLRNQAVASKTPEDRLRADSALTGALGQLQITMENYPQLQASQNFVQLQRSLNEVEEQLAAARRSYNGAVVDYNNAVQTYPTALVASVMNFGTRQMYEAEDRKRGDVDMRTLFTS
ncbi:MAG: LemA family protein [Gemmatimonadota bacterium]